MIGGSNLAQYVHDACFELVYLAIAYLGIIFVVLVVLPKPSNPFLAARMHFGQLDL